jgi:hypothetical protein
MPICNRRRIAFIHTPKTGGSSIEKLLGLTQQENFNSSNPKEYNFDGVDYAPQHLTLDLLGKLTNIDGFTSFCFTRHPYQKAVSEFFYLNPEYRRGEKQFTNKLFEEWVNRELSKKDCDHKIDQYKYTNGCQHIFKYMDFPNAVELMRNIGIDVNGEMPHVLQSPIDTNDIAGNLGQSIYCLLNELYPNDFDELGYKREFEPEPYKELGGGIFFNDGWDAYHVGDTKNAFKYWRMGAELGNQDCIRIFG